MKYFTKPGELLALDDDANPANIIKLGYKPYDTARGELFVAKGRALYAAVRDGDAAALTLAKSEMEQLKTEWR